MALSKQEKVQLVKEYGEKLGRAQVAIWARFGGLTVAELTRFRRQMQNVDAEIVVVKNTLMARALRECGLPHDPEMMSGPCLVAFAYGDISPAVKTLLDYVRTAQERLQVVGGVVGGQLLDAEQVRALSDLPSREVLLAQVVGAMQAPISGLVNTLAGVLRAFVNVIDARKRQLEGSDA